jgi:acrylyl-CoA reductase (NADPH)
MMTQTGRFKALILGQENGAVQAAIQELETNALPEGDVLVRVAYSSLNYKDGLAVTNKAKVVRSYPMVPGIDLAGTVEESHSPAWKPGDAVVLTGWGIGERHWGGYAQFARVKGEWLIGLPEGLDLKQAMGIGTAGFTAMLCVMALEEHGLTTAKHPVIVTGASGGVGSVAVALLANLGYRVAASTGREEAHEYLQSLGAHEITGRLTPSSRPLESERWASAVDTVGGETLAALLQSIAYGGSIAACGNAGGNAFSSTVLPLILRSVNLLGIDSVVCPSERRRTAWKRLARDLPKDTLDKIIQVVPLAAVPALSQKILQGQIRGRVVVDVNA